MTEKPSIFKILFSVALFAGASACLIYLLFLLPTASHLQQVPRSEIHLPIFRAAWRVNGISIALGILTFLTAFWTRRHVINGLTIAFLIATFLLSNHIITILPSKG